MLVFPVKGKGEREKKLQGPITIVGPAPNCGIRVEAYKDSFEFKRIDATKYVFSCCSFSEDVPIINGQPVSGSHLLKEGDILFLDPQKKFGVRFTLQKRTRKEKENAAGLNKSTPSLSASNDVLLDVSLNESMEASVTNETKQEPKKPLAKKDDKKDADIEKQKQEDVKKREMERKIKEDKEREEKERKEKEERELKKERERKEKEDRERKEKEEKEEKERKDREDKERKEKEEREREKERKMKAEKERERKEKEEREREKAKERERKERKEKEEKERLQKEQKEKERKEKEEREREKEKERKLKEERERERKEKEEKEKERKLKEEKERESKEKEEKEKLQKEQKEKETADDDMILCSLSPPRENTQKNDKEKEKKHKHTNRKMRTRRESSEAQEASSSSSSEKKKRSKSRSKKTKSSSSSESDSTELILEEIQRNSKYLSNGTKVIGKGRPIQHPLPYKFDENIRKEKRTVVPVDRLGTRQRRTSQTNRSQQSAYPTPPPRNEEEIKNMSIQDFILETLKLCGDGRPQTFILTYIRQNYNVNLSTKKYKPLFMSALQTLVDLKKLKQYNCYYILPEEYGAFLKRYNLEDENEIETINVEEKTAPRSKETQNTSPESPNLEDEDSSCNY